MVIKADRTSIMAEKYVKFIADNTTGRLSISPHPGAG
jgi:hypothetical protein